ncbi:ABC transporter substrate-binding protein [Paraburkholderia caballeronis]|uniref:Amino acid/amide ABC transporter substrate-binding protein, HAAT family n=1 Tax=Paraburkholderia caballeronis TaxID=416943 RepID=A0A1H7MX83_9BURK|nr:ABC transporter substrate-binding protein [Paraburkholderia caballeronis]PXW26370.1 amino acid/amide ABC transporter substrate-binding protein (HAAT family) [Paraburkholderia caballeronis]PXX01917.1 amino acid/amide ABC transporter substrate-binding protein (HAAT family) [Paraburkholderia caballeronis]RAK01074.1 amino acid/amide ABC transporter substrate-binding protein (HAAT family) [Paraburkholderia caballeronis]TDV16348.1 amino acid/amide ABC transporter substrate-binding protein (HAAT fa
MSSRRTFLRQSTAAAAMLAAPWAARAAAGNTIKIGVLHPVTGAVAYSGQQCRLGALLAIEDINKAGGIKSLGGATIEAVLGDAQSRPEAGAAEVERMNEAGVSAIVGAYASAICLATTQTAAKYGLPHVVDVGVADQIVQRGLTNTFRFGPGYDMCSARAVEYLNTLNSAAGKPAKTVMIVHEESLFGTGTAKLLSTELPKYGFEIKEVVKHPNPTRDFNNIVLRMRAVNPDIVIPANYYDEYALLLRAMKQQRVRPKAVFSVLGGAASSYKFLKEYPDVADGIIDCNHWFNPKDPRVAPLRQRVEAKGAYFSYEVFMTYTATTLLADALERAKSADRAALTAALASSTFKDHLMPYGPTHFVNGQNTGAQPLLTQVQGGDIRVILPPDFREVAPVFPLKG